MAATGFTPISLYYTTTASAAPTAGNLVAGELAINTNDGKLFYKDSSGVVQTIASKSAAALANSTTGSGATVLATSPTVTNPALAGATSGSVTLAVPAVAGSNTATLPAATGTVMVSGNMPAFSAYQSSSQTLSSNTYTKINFQTEEFDTNNNFSSSRFTPTVAGYYQVSGAFQIQSIFCGGAIVVYKNGSQFKSGFTNNTTSTANIWALSCLVFLNGTTDYVELYGSIQVGQALDPNQIGTYFQAVMVRTA